MTCATAVALAAGIASAVPCTVRDADLMVGFRWVLARGIEEGGFPCPEAKSASEVGYEQGAVVLRVTCTSNRALALRSYRVLAYTEGDFIDRPEADPPASLRATWN